MGLGFITIVKFPVVASQWQRVEQRKARELSGLCICIVSNKRGAHRASHNTSVARSGGIGLHLRLHPRTRRQDMQAAHSTELLSAACSDQRLTSGNIHTRRPVTLNAGESWLDCCTLVAGDGKHGQNACSMTGWAHWRRARLWSSGMPSFKEFNISDGPWTYSEYYKNSLVVDEVSYPPLPISRVGLCAICDALVVVACRQAQASAAGRAGY